MKGFIYLKRVGGGKSLKNVAIVMGFLSFYRIGNIVLDIYSFVKNNRNIFCVPDAPL